MEIRTLIVDDEPLARRGVRARLEATSDFVIVGECSSGREAVWAIQEHGPDLVFLDVEMPEMDGFGVVEAVGPDRMPIVVFVTAHDAFAIRAFDTYALDYVLKPVESGRFQQTLDRIRQRIETEKQSELGRRLAAALPELRGGAATATGGAKVDQAGERRLVVRADGRIVLLPLEHLEWIEAEGSYVRLHAGGKTFLLRERLSALEQRLDPALFVRIHRSTIVRIDLIQELHPHSNREYFVVLQGGQKLKLSRTYRDRLSAILGGAF